MRITERVRQLQRLSAECPKGREGQHCRDAYRREIKEQEALAKQKAEMFMREHGIPH